MLRLHPLRAYVRCPRNADAITEERKALDAYSTTRSSSQLGTKRKVKSREVVKGEIAGSTGVESAPSEPTHGTSTGPDHGLPSVSLTRSALAIAAGAALTPSVSCPRSPTDSGARVCDLCPRWDNESPLVGR